MGLFDGAGAVLLVVCAGCGRLFVDADASVSDTAGTACLDTAAVNAAPACVTDGGFGSPDAANPECQQWIDAVVSGANAFCIAVNNTTECEFVLASPACTPGADGDSQCQAWAQRYSRTRTAYGRCSQQWKRCVSADQCIVDAVNSESCRCGSSSLCTSAGAPGALPELCLDENGTHKCGAGCQ